MQVADECQAYQSVHRHAFWAFIEAGVVLCSPGREEGRVWTSQVRVEVAVALWGIALNCRWLVWQFSTVKYARDTSPKAPRRSFDPNLIASAREELRSCDRINGSTAQRLNGRLLHTTFQLRPALSAGLAIDHRQIRRRSVEVTVRFRCRAFSSALQDARSVMSGSTQT